LETAALLPAGAGLWKLAEKCAENLGFAETHFTLLFYENQ
jgi:hypothetical protein